MAVPEKALVDKIQLGPPVRSKRAMREYLFDDLRIDPESLLNLDLKKIIAFCNECNVEKSRLLEQILSPRQGK